ncbi:MAG: hypothetical protein J5746_14750 [Victivallales bacterium]|nr:hypothetical protein [Victivallales bacterium]
MSRLNRLFVALLLVCAICVRAELTVREQDGTLQVLRDGKVLVKSIRLSLLDTELKEPKRSNNVQKDGSQVWNIWSEHPDTRVRMEVARRSDGAVEISMLSNMLPMPVSRHRYVYLDLEPGQLIDKHYDALEGNARGWRPISGDFDAKCKSFGSHWMACDGLIFDFNPMGASSYCNQYRMGAVKGVWSVERKKDAIYIAGGSQSQNAGGFTGIKMVLLEGRNEDYDKMHLMRTYHYNQHLKAKYLLSFGAPATGKQYSNGNVPLAENGIFGWEDAAPQPVVGNKEGALYSCVAGKDAVYCFNGLPDGFYVCTATAGNYTGIENTFDVSFNDVKLAENLNVQPRKVWIGSKTIHVKGGSLRLKLSGNYILSTLGIQPLMADAEDYSMQRPFWFSDGYEPALIYRNVDFPRKYTLPSSIEVLDLPVPGTEMSAEYRRPPRPTLLPPANMPSLAWANDMKMGSMGAGMQLADESCPQELRTSFIDRNVNGKGYNCVMSGFMHSRHTYPTRFNDGIEYNRVLAREAHKRGLKIIDHHDVTILWNQHSGLRTLAERLPELCRGIDDHLPSFQLCPINPDFKKKYFDYWRKNVEAGIDGFQLDEVQFWTHTCSCHYCREAFTRDTGWIYPLNELDKSLADTFTTFNRRWHDWRMATITNWFIDLRKYVQDIKPDLVLSMYTTHWGFTRSAPRYKAGFDIVDLARTFNMFGTEVMTRNVMKSSKSLLPLRKMKNIITKEYGTRLWGIYYTNDWESTYFAWCVANMCGQSAIMAFNMPPNAPAFRDFAKTEGNMQVTGAENVAEIGLLFSTASKDWNKSIGFENGLFGMAQQLEALHIPYEMVGDISLRPEILSKYKVLSLGTSACMSDEQVNAVLDFAEKGGTLHLLGVTALCDETGEMRRQWPFAKIFGFRPDYYSKWKLAECDSVKFEHPARTFVKPGTVNPMQEIRPYGKGHIIYQATDAGAYLYTMEKTAGDKWPYERYPILEKFYREYLANLLKDVRVWNTNAPDKVFTALWKEADGSLVIHFLNATGENNKKGEVLDGLAPKPAFPALPEDIIFSIKCANAKSVTAASPSFGGIRALQYKAQDDGTIEVTLPADLAKQYVVVRIRE